MYSMKNKTKRRKTKTKRRIKRKTRRMVGGLNSQVSVVLKAHGHKPWDGVSIVPADAQHSTKRLFRFTFNEDERVWVQDEPFWKTDDKRRYPFGYLSGINGLEDASFSSIDEKAYNARIKYFEPPELKAEVLAKLNMLQDRPDKDGIDIRVRPYDSRNARWEEDD
jgi:hypothetical protein